MTIDTTKLRELAQKATPGPWTAKNRSDWRECVAEISDWHVVPTLQQSELSNMDVDAAYIAAANPATVLQLLDEIDRLQVNEFFQPDQTLEHAKERIDALEQQLNEAAQCIANQSQTIARLLEIEKAARNLQKAKGRHNTEIAMNRLQATLAASE